LFSGKSAERNDRQIRVIGKVSQNDFQELFPNGL